MNPLALVVIISCCLAIAAVLLYSIFLIDAIFTNIKVEHIDVPSSKKAIKNIEKIIHDLRLEKAIFYDLGSGRGSLAINIKRSFPHFDVYGFDRSGFKIILSRAKAFLWGAKVNFFRRDILKVDIREADIIYTYVWPTTVEKLQEKFDKEAKNGTFFIASTFPFPNWRAILERETLTIKRDPSFEKIFLYRK